MRRRVVTEDGQCNRTRWRLRRRVNFVGSKMASVSAVFSVVLSYLKEVKPDSSRSAFREPRQAE